VRLWQGQADSLIAHDGRGRRCVSSAPAVLFTDCYPLRER